MPAQRDEEWLRQASADQIVMAQAAHELDELLGVERNERGNRVADLRGLPRRSS